MGIRDFLFGEATSKKKPTPKKLSLSRTVVAAAFGSGELIADAWRDLTNEAPMPPESKFAVRCEMLWFFLLMMNKFAFKAAGRKAGALRDRVVLDAIRASVLVFFDSSEVRPGLNSGDWKARAFDQMLEEYNRVGVEYEACTWSPPGEKTAHVREDTFFGKLSARIIRRTDQHMANMLLRMAIIETAAGWLVESKLKQLTEEACSRL